MAGDKQIVLDGDVYAECPDCGTRIHCGTVGVQNLEKWHQGSKICLESKAKQDKNANLKKNGTLFQPAKTKLGAFDNAVGTESCVTSKKCT